MSVTLKVKLISFALVIMNPIDAGAQAKRESSGEYLQKVMVQLQEFNVPSPVNVYDRMSSNNDRNSMVHKNRDKQGHAVQRINMNRREDLEKYNNQSFPYYILPNGKVDLRRVDMESIPQYYQVKRNLKSYSLETCLESNIKYSPS